MTWHAVQTAAAVLALLAPVALAVQHLWLRPRLRRRIAVLWRSLVVIPLQRRVRNQRAALAALTRAARHRSHRPVHALPISEGHHHDRHGSQRGRARAA